jgi:predicted enzyme related to lactoylglutathione lyase
MSDHGQIVWTELNTRDVENAKRFYAETLGWSFREMELPDGPYTVVMSGDRPVMAGIFDIDRPGFEGLPEHWFTYIGVDDIDARVAGVAAAGGAIVRPPFDVPGVGRIAVVREPGGAVVGWMTSVES